MKNDARIRKLQKLAKKKARKFLSSISFTRTDHPTRRQHRTSLNTNPSRTTTAQFSYLSSISTCHVDRRRRKWMRQYGQRMRRPVEAQSRLRYAVDYLH